MKYILGAIVVCLVFPWPTQAAINRAAFEKYWTPGITDADIKEDQQAIERYEEEIVRFVLVYNKFVGSNGVNQLPAKTKSALWVLLLELQRLAQGGRISAESLLIVVDEMKRLRQSIKCLLESE